MGESSATHRAAVRDVRVVQGREHLRFALEAGAIHLAHAALANEREDFVNAEAGA